MRAPAVRAAVQPAARTVPSGIQLAALAVLTATVACASQGLPPGGHPDVTPPMLLRVTPESGTVNVRPRAVEFAFDEIVSERPRGAQTLAGLVVISPSDGKPDVSWERSRVAIRPQHGWRDNTAYSITILPGMTDLRGNAATRAFRTVFSTGATIPNGIVAGAAFDWTEGKPAPSARIDATIGTDTLLKYAIAADSVGRFLLGSLPAERFFVRAWMDLNKNGVRDLREPWDSVTLSVADSVRHDFYMFVHDTLGARLAGVTMVDSVTLRLKFDHALRGDPPLSEQQIAVAVARDSSAIQVRRVLTLAFYDSVAALARAAAADSALRADTTERGRKALAARDSARIARARDSVARLQIDSLRALRDTVRREPPPVPGRPVPPTEFVVITAAPLPVDTAVRVSARDVQAIEGPPRTSDRLIVRPKPAPRDTTRTDPPAQSLRRPPHAVREPR